MTQVKIFMFFGDFEWVLQPKMGFWDVLEHGNVLTNLIMHLKNIFTKNTSQKIQGVSMSFTSNESFS